MDRGAIADDVGTSLIGAGMISVLLFPLVATAIVGSSSSGVESPEYEYYGAT